MCGVRFMSTREATHAGGDLDGVLVLYRNREVVNEVPKVLFMYTGRNVGVDTNKADLKGRRGGVHRAGPLTGNSRNCRPGQEMQ